VDPSKRRSLRRVALTGGIATGKSFCLRRFAHLGVPTIDTDVVARHVVAPGTPGLAAVVARFGAELLTPDGALDRPALGRIVFADADARAELERIIHPAVYRSVEAWFEEEAENSLASGHPGFAMADIPLLFETRQQHRFDHVIVAACSEAQQLERLMGRNGLSLADAQRRLDAQLPLADKRARADTVIDTSGTEEETISQVDRVWEALRTTARD
jgi:dephospho-CoA kinase